MTPRSVRHIAWFAVNTSLPSRLLQKLRAQHQALDLVGAAFDLVFIVSEVDVPDHGAALEHGGRALQLQVLDQRDAVALGEQRAVGIPHLDVHVMLSLQKAVVIAREGGASNTPRPLDSKLISLEYWIARLRGR